MFAEMRYANDTAKALKQVSGRKHAREENEKSTAHNKENKQLQERTTVEEKWQTKWTCVSKQARLVFFFCFISIFLLANFFVISFNLIIASHTRPHRIAKSKNRMKQWQRTQCVLIKLSERRQNAIGADQLLCYCCYCCCWDIQWISNQMHAIYEHSESNTIKP